MIMSLGRRYYAKIKQIKYRGSAVDTGELIKVRELLTWNLEAALTTRNITEQVSVTVLQIAQYQEVSAAHHRSSYY